MSYKDIFELRKKVAVITGGCGVIGKEIVKALAEKGAVVILAEINKNEGKKLAKALNGSGLKVFFKFLDITKEGSVQSLIEDVDSEFGRIDIWVNNAYPRTKDWGNAFENILVRSWKKNIDMHLNGYFICLQKICRYMKKKKSGSIINLASIYGFAAPDFSVYENTKMTMPAAYSVIKAGIINLSKYLASYLGKYNVRVNCISPGGVYNKQAPVFVKRYIQKTVLGRMCEPRDIAGAVLYLASDASSYVTGHNLVVDGGWSIT